MSRRYDVAVIGAGIVGCRHRARAGRLRPVRRADRGPRRRRRRHQQGQHRDPAHRLRRHAGHAGVPAGPRAATSCCRTTPRRPASRSSAPARCWSPGPTTSSPRCPALQRQGRAQRLPRLRDRRRRRGLPAGAATSAPGALGGLTVPDESIICTWTTTSRWPPTPSAAGRRLLLGASGRSRSTVDRTTHRAAHLRRRRRAPAGWSTPPGSAPTSSTGCSATTGSPSPRAGASCSSSTSWPGRWSTGSCCRSRPRSARAC